MTPKELAAKMAILIRLGLKSGVPFGAIAEVALTLYLPFSFMCGMTLTTLGDDSEFGAQWKDYEDSQPTAYFRQFLAEYLDDIFPGGSTLIADMPEATVGQLLEVTFDL